MLFRSQFQVKNRKGYDLDFEVKRYKEELEDDSKLSNDTNCIFSACMFEIDNNTGKTLTIKRILM